MFDITRLRDMTEQDLAILGAGQVAYIRAENIQGEEIMAIMAGDGRRLGVAPDYVSAVAAVYKNELDLVSVH